MKLHSTQANTGNKSHVPTHKVGHVGLTGGGRQVHLDHFWCSRLGAVKKKATLYCKLQGLTFASAVNYNTKWS